jgi:hypothetical protein
VFPHLLNRCIGIFAFNSNEELSLISEIAGFPAEIYHIFDS